MKDWQIKFIEENKDTMMQKDIAKHIKVRAGEVTRYFFNKRHFSVKEKYFNVNCKKTIKGDDYSWVM